MSNQSGDYGVILRSLNELKICLGIHDLSIHFDNDKHFILKIKGKHPIQICDSETDEYIVTNASVSKAILRFDSKHKDAVISKLESEVNQLKEQLEISKEALKVVSNQKPIAYQNIEPDNVRRRPKIGNLKPGECLYTKPVIVGQEKFYKPLETYPHAPKEANNE